MTSLSGSSQSSGAPLEEGLESLEDAVRAQQDAYLDTLLTEGVKPLQATLEKVRATHDAARPSCEADESSRRAVWEAVRHYRQRTVEGVWRPVREQLDASDLGSLLRDQALQAAEARATLTDHVPASATRPVPDGHVASAKTNGKTGYWPRVLMNGWQSVRGLLGSVTASTREVPLTVLVEEYVAGTLAKRQASAFQTAEQCLAQWTARLEREAIAWTHRILDIERVLDHPSFHAPEQELRVPAASGDPTSGIMAPDLEALLSEVDELAQSLDGCLEAGESLSLGEAEEVLSTGRTEMMQRLRPTAEGRGTVEGDSASWAFGTRRTENRRQKLLDRWPDWFAEVSQRLAFLIALATLRDELIDRHEALVADVVAAGLAPARSAGRAAAEELDGIREALDSLLEEPAVGEEDELVRASEHQVEAASEILEDTLLAPLRETTPRRSARAVVASHREAVGELLDAQPEGFVLHAPVAPDESPIEPDEAHTLEWQNGCREVLDEVLFDTWNSALSPLIAAAEAETDRADEVRAIVQFNLDAALQDVQDLRSARRQGESDGSFIDNARELALGGLQRALDLLGTDDEALAEAEGTVLHRTWEATTRTWTDVHDRARAAGQARATLLRLRGELVRGTRWLAVEAGRQARATTTQARRLLHRMQRHGRRIMHLGHAAVGTRSVDEGALRETIDALSTVDDVLADLPLVYRRLFSFRPIQNEDFLVARDTDRAIVERHRERWKDGLTNALVVTGPAGSGRTSLVNVLRKTTFRSAQRHTIELTERITTEADFAALVVRELGLSVDEEPLSLDAVAAQLQSQPVPDRVRVCFIEHFEHVFHRTVAGTVLGARILSFLSETDTRVLWIATTTDETWQFVEASEPAAARLVVRHRLDPLDRSELEELVMTRHRRSGLRLNFDVPDESTHPILARRVRAIDDESRRQALLRSEFFDHLYDVCGQNVMLALFYWFRSVTLDVDRATLRVHPLSAVPFDILETFPLPHAFALKALLEHGTLTVGELAEVQGVDLATSRSLLEALANAMVIAPADRVEGPGTFRFTTVEAETRYRIRPLLIHPVTRFLRSRNIVH